MAVVHHHRFLRRSHYFFGLFRRGGHVDAIGAIGLGLERRGRALGGLSGDDRRGHRHRGLAQGLGALLSDRTGQWLSIAKSTRWVVRDILVRGLTIRDLSMSDLDERFSAALHSTSRSL